MRRITTLLVLALALIALPAAAAKAYIDYDESIDFSALKTFQWVETGAPSLEMVNPLLHNYAKDQIIAHLEEAGLTQVEENADFQITYHTDSESEVRVDTQSYGYGYGGGWRWGGYGYRGPSTSQVRTYETGTLIIDAWDGESKQLIWRGTASDTTTDNPKKARKKLDKAIAKIVNQWEKELRK
jgi:hypothetical protein